MHEITLEIKVKKAQERNERYIQIHNMLWDKIIKPYIQSQGDYKNADKM